MTGLPETARAVNIEHSSEINGIDDLEAAFRGGFVVRATYRPEGICDDGKSVTRLIFSVSEFADFLAPAHTTRNDDGTFTWHYVEAHADAVFKTVPRPTFPPRPPAQWAKDKLAEIAGRGKVLAFESPNLSIALRYAAAGLAVFPCEPKDRWENGELIKAKKSRLMHWRSSSTTRVESLRFWWKSWPDSIVGIDLAKTGLIVIDADRHPNEQGVIEHDGVAALAALEAEHDPFDAHPIVKTPSHGEHHIFRQPDGLALGNGEGALPRGINIRGAGGYIIAAGSVSDLGAWLPDDDAPDLIESFRAGVVPPLPDWLVNIIRAPKVREDGPPRPAEGPAGASHGSGTRGEQAYAQTALDGNACELAACTEGNRNTTLNAIAYRMGRMVARGWIDESTVCSRLYDAAEACGLLRADGHKQVVATIRSGLRGGKADPHPDLEDVGIRVEIRDDGTRIDADTGEVLGTERAKVAKAGEDYDRIIDRLSHTEGLIGELTEFTVRTARRPNRILALGGSLAVISTLIGRRIATPERGAPGLYLVGLDATSGGKQHVIDSCGFYLDTAGMPPDCVGPSEFMSGSAIVDLMNEAPLNLCLLDEFGSFLSRINARNATGYERQLMKVFRELWGVSPFRFWSGPRWAQKKFERLYAPAFGFYGLSTPDQFWKSLTNESLEDGFVNRLIMLQPPHVFVPQVTPSTFLEDIGDDLRDDLAALYRGGLPAEPQRIQDVVWDAHKRNGSINPIVPRWAPGARKAYEDFRNEIDRRIFDERNLDRFLGRVAENAVRLATIRAAGRNPRNPLFGVDRSDFEWAEEFMRATSARTIDAGRQNIGKGNDPNAEKSAAILAFIERHPKGVKRAELTKYLSSMRIISTVKLLDDLLGALIEGNQIGTSGRKGAKADPLTYHPIG